jgi:hypothetical protein
MKKRAFVVTLLAVLLAAAAQGEAFLFYSTKLLQTHALAGVTGEALPGTQVYYIQDQLNPKTCTQVIVLVAPDGQLQPFASAAVDPESCVKRGGLPIPE